MDSTSVQEDFKDDKRIVTEVAFGVNPTLLGRKLATPFQRGMAMTIDAILVLLLTDLSGFFWALLVGVALFRAGRSADKETWRTTRKMVRALGVIVIVITVFGSGGSWIKSSTDQFVQQTMESSVAALADSEVEAESDDIQQVIRGSRIALAVVEISNFEDSSDCDLGCLTNKVGVLVEEMAHLGLERAKVAETLNDAISDKYFADAQVKTDFINSQIADGQYTSSLVETKSDISKDNINSDESAPVEMTTVTSELDGANEEKIVELPSEQLIEASEEKPVYSIVEYTKALIADLGLGFGWAALYFTAFSAWWKGQTPGKRLMGIRVVQLDGTYMSGWDAFGRYGGYGAGFATGLLGFAQIIWDSNRQAIQDKISATVVIQGGIE